MRNHFAGTVVDDEQAFNSTACRGGGTQQMLTKGELC
jgi:hypothetical protein